MKTRKNIYFHKVTGEIVKATKKQAKNLPEEYEKIEFVKNDAGVPVMRFKFNGATVDVSENNESEVAQDGNGHTE